MRQEQPKNRPRWADPFILFAIGGVILFIGASVLEERRAASDEQARRMLITEEVQAELRTRFERAQGRAPTPAEQAAAIERHVRDQILFDQAIEWGLHRNDVVVRRRLVERLRMLFGSYADTGREQADLESTYEKYQERFEIPASIGFRHVFVDRDVHGEQSLARAQALAEQLAQTGSAEGDLWYQPPTQTPRSMPRIEALMGKRFAATLGTLPVGEWSAPVASSYGYHLVFIDEKIPSRLPALEEVLEQVWVLHRRDREQESFATFSDRLRERYEVTIEDSGTGADTHHDEDGHGP